MLELVNRSYLSLIQVVLDVQLNLICSIRNQRKFEVAAQKFVSAANRIHIQFISVLIVILHTFALPLVFLFGDFTGTALVGWSTV
jgi:hypothetical protein